MSKLADKKFAGWRTAKQIFILLGRKERILVGLTMFVRLALVSLDLVGIFLVGVVVSLLSGTTISPTSPLTHILDWLRQHGFANGYAVILGAGVAFFITKGLISALLNRMTGRYVARIEWEKSVDVASKLIKSDLSVVEKWSTQDVLFGATGSVASAITQAIMIGSTVVGEIALLVAISTYLAISNLVLFISIAVFFVAVGWIMNLLVSRASVKAAKRMHDTNQASQGLLLDVLSNFRQLSLSPNRYSVIGQFSSLRKEAASQGARYQTITGLPRYITEIAVMLGVAILVFQRAWGDANAVPAAVVAVFLAGIFRIVSSMLPLQAALSSWKLVEHQARISLEILSHYSGVEQETGDANKSQAGGPLGIAAVDLHFDYDSETLQVLNGVNFKILPGEFVAIIGPSGAGKSTLADLIVGLRIPSSGQVTISDLDAREFVRHFSGSVSYVPQNTPLFSGTLRQNVSLNFGKETEKERYRVIESMEAAGLCGFERQFEFGLDALIGPEFQSLSGGQQQRIGLARALFSKPGLVVLDEATSALDNDAQRLVQETIEALRGTVTLVVIAHREETIRSADRVFKLTQGALEEL